MASHERKFRPGKPWVLRLVVRGLPDVRPWRKERYGNRLGLTGFLAVLFDANERLPVTRKLDDDTLRSVIINEFPPGVYKTVDRLRERKITVGWLRALYNLGQFTRSKPGPGERRGSPVKPGDDPSSWLKSWSYIRGFPRKEGSGEPCGRTGKPLTEEQKARLGFVDHSSAARGRKRGSPGIGGEEKPRIVEESVPLVEIWGEAIDHYGDGA